MILLMNIADRLRESEDNFEQKKAEREQHLQLADECMTEMTKLQGEYRLLQELQVEEAKKKVNKNPTAIEAVPDPETEKK